jgi:hypothetical protein
MGGIFITAGHRPAAEALAGPCLKGSTLVAFQCCLSGSSVRVRTTAGNASLACGYENQALRALYPDKEILLQIKI